VRISSLRLGLTVLATATIGAAGATAGAVGSASRAADSNSAAVQHAFLKTSTAESAHFSFTIGITGAGTSTSGFTVGGAGGLDTKHQAATFTVNLGALAGVLGGAVGGVSVPKTIGVVSLKNVVYVHLPSLASQVTPGKEWLRFDSSSVPTSVTGGVKPSQVDPQKALATLTTSLSVHKLGSTTMRGASTAHYRIAANVAKLVTILPKAQQAAELKALKSAGIKSLPIDVYVDGSGYVRRVAIALTNLKVRAGLTPASIKLSFDLFDFGHSVHVAAPPAGKTADGARVLAQLFAGLGAGG
jgi:hypothetical protein